MASIAVACAIGVTVSAILLLNSAITSIYRNSLEVNDTWTNRTNRYVELRKLAAGVAAPAADVLATRDLSGQSRRLDDAANAFNMALAAARLDLATDAPSAIRGEVSDHLGRIERAKADMESSIRSQFTAMASGDLAMVNRWASRQGHDLQGVNGAITNLTTRVRSYQIEYLGSQLYRARSLARWQYPMGGLLVLVLIASFAHEWRLRARMARAIDEAELAHTAVRGSEADLRLLLDSAGEAIYGIDREGRCTFCNTASLRVLGYASTEALVGKNMHALIHHSRPDGSPYPEFECLTASACSRGQGSYASEVVFWRSDGTPFHAEATSSPRVRDGQVLGSVVVFTDITARKQAAQALEESERRFMDVLRASEDAILLIDNNAFVECNEATVRMLGYQARGEILSRHPSALSPPVQLDGRNSGEKADEMIRQAFERGFHRFEWMHRRANGEDFPVEVSLTPTVHHGRQVLYCVWRDITDRKRALEQLQSRMAAIDAAADMVVICDRKGQITYVNPAFTAATGYAQEEVTGRTPKVLRSGQHSQAFYASMWQTILSGNIWHGEIVNRRKDGSLYPEEMTITPVKDSAGTVAQFVAIKRDVTDKKSREALAREHGALREAVASMEHVLGIVGHELRTPLAGVRAMAELLLMDQIALEDQSRFLTSIHDEVLRMSGTINDLLEAARVNSGHAQWNWSVLSVHAACREATESIAALVDPGRVTLKLTTDPESMEMQGDEGAIRRLVVNLLSNAAKHTVAGAISVHARGIEEGGKRWIRIEVADTGSGIPSEIVSRLGEAFALNAGVVGAKHVQGTGLGLSICKGIVAAHGGRLSVRSELGVGTTVTATLRADLTAAAGHDLDVHIFTATSGQAMEQEIPR